MNLTIVKTIFFKEVLDTLRDKRTLLAMIGVPLILYPALFLVATQLAVMQQSKMEAEASHVAAAGDASGLLSEWLAEMDQVEVSEPGDPEAALSEGELDAILRYEGDLAAALGRGKTAEIQIEFDAAEAPSREAKDRLVEALGDKHEALLEARMRDAGFDPAYGDPLDMKEENVASGGKMTGSLLGMVLPLIMVVMIGVGAFYPAVDLTAGEKERGTFETLLSTPISKFEVVAGKFLTVFCIAMFTGILNLASMSLTFYFQISQIAERAEESIDLQLSLPPSSIASILLVLVPLAFFISAVMMSVAVLARSFKEAQNYVTPFFMFMSFPAAMAFLPGVKLSATTQFIPIVNAALLFKSLMMGQAGVEDVFAVFVSTAALALLTLVIASWLFQREEVILSEQGGLPLTLKRSTFERRAVLTPGMAFFLYALCMLLFFYAGTYAQMKDVYVGLLVTLWGLVLLPTLAYLWFTRTNIQEALRLKPVGLAPLAGCVLASLGWPLIISQVAIWQNRVLPTPPELHEELSRALSGMDRIDLVPLLFLIALSPAICEEALFRGAMLSGLRRHWPPAAAIVVSAICFGAMHMSVYRIMPTTLSGIVFGYMVYRTGSIIPAAAGHFILNGLIVVLSSARFEAFAEKTGLAESLARWPKEGVPLLALAVSLVAFVAGLVLLRRFTPNTESPDQPAPPFTA